MMERDATFITRDVKLPRARWANKQIPHSERSGLWGRISEPLKILYSTFWLAAPERDRFCCAANASIAQHSSGSARASLFWFGRDRVSIRGPLAKAICPAVWQRSTGDGHRPGSVFYGAGSRQRGVPKMAQQLGRSFKD